MPLTFRIDPDLNLAFVKGVDSLATKELIALQGAFRADPAFRPDLDLLFDFREIVRHELSGGDLRRIAANTPMARSTRRAFVVRQQATMGLVRMFAVFLDAQDQTYGTFRDLRDACRWLGIRTEDAERHLA